MTQIGAELIRMEGLSLSVSEVERSVMLYRVLGFEPVLPSLPHFALLRLGEATLGLMRADLSGWPFALRSKVHVEFGSDDLDALHVALLKAGAVIHKPPTDSPWERAMSLRNPDGYHVEISQGRRRDIAATPDRAPDAPEKT